MKKIILFILSLLSVRTTNAVIYGTSSRCECNCSGVTNYIFDLTFKGHGIEPFFNFLKYSSFLLGSFFTLLIILNLLDLFYKKDKIKIEKYDIFLLIIFILILSLIIFFSYFYLFNTQNLA